MKTELILPKEPARSYPYIGVLHAGTNKETQVCFTDPKSGIVINAGIDSSWHLYSVYDFLDESIFTKITEHLKAEPERKYPYCGIANQGTIDEKVVYFTEPDMGVLIYEKKEHFMSMHFTNNWIETNFTPLSTGTQIIITI